MKRKTKGDLELRRMKIELDSLNTPASLAKSHKIIRTEKAKELLFLKLCKQIEKNESNDKRRDNQQKDRKTKRCKIRLIVDK